MGQWKTQGMGRVMGRVRDRGTDRGTDRVTRLEHGKEIRLD